MGSISVSSPTLSYRPLMIFIDGGYLRKEVKKNFGHDEINFEMFSQIIRKGTIRGNIISELVRVYYYDAQIEHEENPTEYQKQKDYFQKIRLTANHEVKLGRLIKMQGDKYRQKGVDILLAIDMITKAYQNHYALACLVAGDDDYVDLIRSIKDLTGKRVIGAYFKDSVSSRLVESFDERIILSKDILQQCIK